MHTQIQSLNLQSLLAPYITNNFKKRKMSLPTVHAQAISSAPVTAVSAVAIDDMFDFDGDQLPIDCDFIEFVGTALENSIEVDPVYTVQSSDVYICDDFDDWVEENVPRSADTPPVPVANTVEEVETVEQSFYCGTVAGPTVMAKAEYYDKDVEDKISKMKGLSLSDNGIKKDETDAVFAEIIQDFASESYNTWCLQEANTLPTSHSPGGGRYYVEEEVPDVGTGTNATPSEVPQIPGMFSVGSVPNTIQQPRRVRERSLDLTEQKRKHRTEAIKRWKQKRQEKLAERRMLDARQVATSKRERTNGKFAKRKINWVSITEVSSS